MKTNQLFSKAFLAIMVFALGAINQALGANCKVIDLTPSGIDTSGAYGSGSTQQVGHCLGIGIFIIIILVLAQCGFTEAAGNWELLSTIQTGGGSYNPDTLVSIDPQNGSMTMLGPSGATPQQVYLDMDPVSGFLFGTNAYANRGVITRINPSTGQWNVAANIMNSTSPLNLNEIAFSPGGTLYGIANMKTLGIINLGAATFSPVADLDISLSNTGMDFSPQGVLYLVDETSTKGIYKQWLHTIDASTGQITSSIQIGNYNAGDIDFAPDGYIYHTNYSWATIKMAPATGVQTLVGFGEYGALGGIASIPEPATLLLFGLGAAVLRKRRR
jgi:hypothetical protein